MRIHFLSFFREPFHKTELSERWDLDKWMTSHSQIALGTSKKRLMRSSSFERARAKSLSRPLSRLVARCFWPWPVISLNDSFLLNFRLRSKHESLWAQNQDSNEAIMGIMGHGSYVKIVYSRLNYGSNAITDRSDRKQAKRFYEFLGWKTSAFYSEKGISFSDGVLRLGKSQRANRENVPCHHFDSNKEQQQRYTCIAHHALRWKSHVPKKEERASTMMIAASIAVHFFSHR